MLSQSGVQFLEALSSAAPIPGGGGAAALVGAQGVALGKMVGNLTLGKQKYAAVQEDIVRMMQILSVLQTELMAMVQRDADVFEPLSKAYGMPSATEEEKAQKALVLESATKEATLVPLEMMEQALRALVVLEEMGEKGTRIAISDVAVGAECLKACVFGGAMNVYINTKWMKDREFAQSCDEKADRIKQEAKELAERIYESVEEVLRCP